MDNEIVAKEIETLSNYKILNDLCDSPFIVVTRENCDVLIPQICLAVLSYGHREQWHVIDNEEFLVDKGNTCTDETANSTTDLLEEQRKEVKKLLESTEYKELSNMLQKFETPYTIANENYHIDRAFRDTYYMYFSNQHFETKRYSRRLSFFQGVLNELLFFGTDSYSILQDKFMGTCVINPLMTGSIGKTLINPKYILTPNQKPSYMRLSTYTVHVFGKKLQVKAFPYRMQDQETMRCAEVALLNLLDYYSNTYEDYRSVVPEEIISNEQKHSFERTLPARGVTSTIMSSVLSDFGFSTRLYDINALDTDAYSLTAVNNWRDMKRWLYYYIESGIPVAVNLRPISGTGDGHSVVCIGHGSTDNMLIKKAQRHKWIPWEDKECHPIINSADFFNTFVVIDDNKPIYQLQPYEQLSQYPDMRLDSIIVPMYKRMFMEAPDAHAVILALLHEKEFSIDAWSGDFLEKGEDVIMRLFMTSSHSLKRFRSETLYSTYARICYGLIPMPRFVWVCELYRVKDFDNHKAFGEVVIDATSTRNRAQRSLIMMHYPGIMVVRHPSQSGNLFDDEIILSDELSSERASDKGLFEGFSRNLEHFS